MNNTENSSLFTKKTKITSIYSLIIAVVISSFLVSCSSKTSYNFPHVNDERWIVVNYWASWCPPCRHEIPEFNQLSKKHAIEIAVYGINYDELTGETLKKELEKLNIQFEQLNIEYSQQFAPLNITSLPTTLIFNHQGLLIEKLTGVQTEQSIIKHITELKEQ